MSLDQEDSGSSYNQDRSRVVFVSAAGGVWGAELSMMALAGGLRDVGWTVELVCFDGELARRWAESIGSEPFAVRRPTRAGRLSESAALWRAVSKKTVRNDTVILFTYYLVVLAPLLSPLLRARGVKIVLDMHDNLERRRAQTVLRVCGHACTSIVAISQYTASQFGRHRRRVGVLNRPIAHETRASFRLERDRKQIGIVGRLVAEKNHSLLVVALRDLPSDYILHVVGDLDPDRPEEGRRVIREMQNTLADRVVIHGHLSPEEAFTSIGTLVVANGREPLGRTTLEAQLCGVLAIVPDTGGASELVRNGETGYKYKTDDPVSLSTVIQAAAECLGGDAIIARAKRHAEAVTDPAEYAQEYMRLAKGLHANV